METLSLSCEVIIEKTCSVCGKGATNITCGAGARKDDNGDVSMRDDLKTDGKGDNEDSFGDEKSKKNEKNVEKFSQENGKIIKNNEENKDENMQKNAKTTDAKNDIVNNIGKNNNEEMTENKTTDNLIKSCNNNQTRVDTDMDVTSDISTTKSPNVINETYLNGKEDIKSDIIKDEIDCVKKYENFFDKAGVVGCDANTAYVSEGVDGVNNEIDANDGAKCGATSDVKTYKAFNNNSKDILSNDKITNIENIKNGDLINSYTTTCNDTKNKNNKINIKIRNNNNKNNNPPSYNNNTSHNITTNSPIILKDNIIITKTTKVSDLLTLCLRHFSLQNVSNASDFFRINSWDTHINTRDIKTDSAMQALAGLNPHITYVLRLCVGCDVLKVISDNDYHKFNSVNDYINQKAISDGLYVEKFIGNDDNVSSDNNDDNDNGSSCDGDSFLSGKSGKVSNGNYDTDTILKTTIKQPGDGDFVNETRNDKSQIMENGEFSVKDSVISSHGKRCGEDLVGYEGEVKRLCGDERGCKPESNTGSKYLSGTERLGEEIGKLNGRKVCDESEKSKNNWFMKDDDTDCVENKNNEQVEAYDLSLKNTSKIPLSLLPKPSLESDVCVGKLETQPHKPKSPKHLIEKNIINKDAGINNAEHFERLPKFPPNISPPDFWSPFNYWLLLYNTLKQNSQLVSEQTVKHSNFLETSRGINGVSNDKKKHTLNNNFSEAFLNSFENKAFDLSKNDMLKKFNVLEKNQNFCKNLEGGHFRNEREKLNLASQRELPQTINGEHVRNNEIFTKDSIADYDNDNVDESTKNARKKSYDDQNVFENNFTTSFPCSTHLFVQRLIKQQSNLQQNYPVINQKPFSAPHQHNNQLPKSGQQGYKKRSRIFIDPLTEIPKLEGWFSDQSHPSIFMIERFTNELNSSSYRQRFPKLEPKNLQLWFKNHRAKVKRLQENRLQSHNEHHS